MINLLTTSLVNQNSERTMKSNHCCNCIIGDVCHRFQGAKQIDGQPGGLEGDPVGA